jgi:hypothetical protein
MAHKKHTPVGFALDWALSGGYAAATLWHRLAFGGAYSMMSEADRRDETARMVHEKLSASVEGGLNASMETMRVMTKAALGKLSADELLAAPSAIMSAGLQPAMRKVRANSRRLNRRAASKP